MFVSDAKGLGSLSMDRQGRLWGAHRTERPGSTKADKDTIENAITILAPAKDRKVIADKWADDGAKLNVRPNDLLADSKGGAYFTVGCLYYANEKGATIVADNIRTNGIAFSPDDKVLYVTNAGGIVAFDVKGPGKLENRRDFAMLPQGAGGDGIAIDNEGRLYVSSGPGVQVIDKTGKWLGVIPSPRGIIHPPGLAVPTERRSSSPAAARGMRTAKPIRQGPQNTAATVYKLTRVLAARREGPRKVTATLSFAGKAGACRKTKAHAPASLAPFEAVPSSRRRRGSERVSGNIGPHPQGLSHEEKINVRDQATRR